MLHNTPQRFHIGNIEGVVGGLLVHPEADTFGELPPLVDVCEYALAAFLIECRDAVGLYVFFAREIQLFLDFKLDRKAVRIPASATVYAISAHGLVARYRVLEGP